MDPHHTHYILQVGKPYPHTTVTTSDLGMFADYTGGKLALDYLAELNAKRPAGSPEFVMLPNEEAIPALEQAAAATYTKPWRWITEERYMEMLEVLPPKNWRTVGGVELFQLSEHTSGLYTAHFAAFQGYHYEGCFNVKTTTYEQHAAEIVKLARLFIGSYPAGIVYADRYTSKGGDYKPTHCSQAVAWSAMASLLSRPFSELPMCV